MALAMLANTPQDVQLGQLDREIHLPSTAKVALMKFIAEELPSWRDHPDRPNKTAEATLTEHLCDYLNGAAYRSPVWSHIQFRTETSDEVRAGRKIDLTVKPRGVALVIENRRHSQFDALFPIECKRLPTPHEDDRDEREYVITGQGTTGGIQRFKFGYHGAAHRFAAMIGYVQEQTFAHWIGQVNRWIRELSEVSDSTWNDSDLIHSLCDLGPGLCTLQSKHLRAGNLGECELSHVWIRMNN